MSGICARQSATTRSTSCGATPVRLSATASTGHPVVADQFDLGGQAGDARRGQTVEPVVVRALRGVLEDHAGDRTGQHQRRAARPGRMAQRTLTFDDHHVGVDVVGAVHDRALEFTGDEVAEQRVEDDSVSAALHPAGLPGVDHLGAHAAVVEFTGQHPGRGALADGAVGAEHRDAGGPDRIHRAVPEPQLPSRGRPADVGDRGPVRGDQAGEFGVISQVVVQATDEVQSGRRALQEQFAQLGAQAAAVRGVPDDRNRGLRGVADRVGHRRHDRDTGRSSVDDQPGIASGQRVIDHHTHREPVAAAHQSVGDLALQGGQAPVGKDDGRRGRHRSRVACRGGPGECGGSHGSSFVGVGVTRTKLPARRQVPASRHRPITCMTRCPSIAGHGAGIRDRIVGEVG